MDANGQVFVGIDGLDVQMLQETPEAFMLSIVDLIGQKFAAQDVSRRLCEDYLLDRFQSNYCRREVYCLAEIEKLTELISNPRAFYGRINAAEIPQGIQYEKPKKIFWATILNLIFSTGTGGILPCANPKHKFIAAKLFAQLYPLLKLVDCVGTHRKRRSPCKWEGVFEMRDAKRMVLFEIDDLARFGVNPAPNVKQHFNAHYTIGISFQTACTRDCQRADFKQNETQI